jgi:hypothetical protein
MLEGRLGKIPFPFIGADVPEGHCGQSVRPPPRRPEARDLRPGSGSNGLLWDFPMRVPGDPEPRTRV